jgi:hypothetical protein
MVLTRQGWMHDARVQAVLTRRRYGNSIRPAMMFRTPYVAESLRLFSAIVADSIVWTAIGADAEYGAVLSGDALAFPIVNAWMEESEWRLDGFSGFRPSRDRETALIIGDGLSLASAVLASLWTNKETRESKAQVES